nr:expressed protein [Hymenolepis microstoma]
MLTDPAPSENVFVRYGTRSLYIITGLSKDNFFKSYRLVCCILGVIGAIGFSVFCVFAGIFLFFIGLFILITEAPFCCAFIPQTEYITRIVTKIGPLPIAIVLALLGIIAMAMCPSVSMGFALCFLLASAALRIREFILLRRGGASGFQPESATRTGNVYPAAPPAYGAGGQSTNHLLEENAHGTSFK